jgi:uncharacterized membrane protein YbhN (UPF0104 family)
VLKRSFKILGGLALVGALWWTLDFAAILATLRRVDPVQWSLSVLTATLASLACAWRWSRISAALSAPLSIWTASRIYAEAITINNVLPGAILGGDAWRALQLKRRGAKLGDATLSVLIDRLAGLWIVGVFGALGWSLLGRDAHLTPWAAWLYGVVLIAVIIGMPLTLFIASRVLDQQWLPNFIKQRLAPLRSQQGILLHAWRRALWPSIPVQALAILTFGLCLRAASVHLDPLTLMMSSGFVFMSLAIPISLAGWGLREAAAVVILSGAGIPAESAAVGAALYGLAATAQALMALPLFLLNRPEPESATC